MLYLRRYKNKGVIGVGVNPSTTFATHLLVLFSLKVTSIKWCWVNIAMENVKIEKKEKSVLEITGEIPFKELQSKRERAVRSLGQNVQIDGFRKGKVPEKIVMEKVGEPAILNEMANLAMQEAYPKIILDNEINPISSPQITITKLAPDNPLGFKISVPVIPEVKLPEYKNLSEEVELEKFEIKDEEVDDVINKVLESKKEEGTEKLPELTDELAKSLGDFKDVPDLKEKVKEGVRQEKEIQAKNKRRTAILEKIIQGSEIDLPEIAIESELQKMSAQFKSDVERMGLKWEDYLEKLNKNEEDLKKEWRPDAEKRAKSQIVLNQIAIAENLVAEKEEVEKEVEYILSHHKDASPERARIFAEQMLTNEQVLKFLEGEEKK